MTYEIPPAVQRGSALLDKHIPGWYDLIDTRVLDLNSPYDCILGQLARQREKLPQQIQKDMNRGRAFTSLLQALERAEHPKKVWALDLDMHEYAFIEELDWTGWGQERLVNRTGWRAAIALRKQQAFQRAEERMNTAIAQEVKAGIDAELLKMLSERATYSLVA